MSDFANNKLNSDRTARLKKIAVGALASVLCMGATGFASAETLHHMHARRTHMQADVNRDYMATYEPVFRGTSVGAWRYQTLTPRCDRSYPMTESAACGTASGGPAGGIN